MYLPKLVIFDLDGTLIDSASGIHKATVQACVKLNLKVPTEEETRSFIGNGVTKLMERVLIQVCDVQDLHYTDALLEQFYVAYEQVCSNELPVVYPGIEEAFVYLEEQGVQLALVTNKPQRYIPDILNKLNWQHRFVSILGGDSLPERKPSALPLIHTMNTAGETEAWMVGDSPVDQQAAANAQIPFVALTYGYNQGIPFNPNDCLLCGDNLHEILKA